MPNAWIEEGERQIESTLKEYQQYQKSQAWDTKIGFEGVVTY